MNKLLVGTALVLGAGTIITPKLIGSQVESQIQSSVDKFEVYSGYKVTVTDIKSGWFTTTSRVNFALDYEEILASVDPSISPESLPKFSITLDLDVQHGPVLFTQGFGIGLAAVNLTSDDSAYAEFIEKSSNVPLIAQQGMLFFNGAYQYKNVTPAFSLKNSDIKIGSTHMEGSMTAHSQDYSLFFGGAHIKEEAAYVEFGETTFNVSADLGYSNFLSGEVGNGTFDISLSKLKTKATLTDSGFDLNDIKVEGQSVLSDSAESADIKLRYTISDLSFNTFTLDDLVFDMELTKLSTHAFKQFQALQQSTLGLQPEQISKVYDDFIKSVLIDVVKLEPELNVTEFSFKLGGGQFKSSLFSNISEFDTLPSNLNDPSFWLNHIALESQANMEVTALRNIIEQVLDKDLKTTLADANLSEEEYQQLLDQQVDSTIAALEAGGTFIKDEELYKYHFLLKDGQAALNGNPMPIPLTSNQP